jgi:biopolymer transport protein ExbD
MAMTTGKGPFDAGDDDAPILDINTTPLIDVMLVLLVMLIITIPIQLHAVDLTLPVAVPPKSDEIPQVVKIDIDAGDTVFWNGEALADRAALVERLAAASRLQPQPEVHVRPHPRSRYASFAGVMVAADAAGLRRLGVVGDARPAP